MSPQIPKEVIDALANMILPEIQKLYECHEDKTYLAEQEEKNANSLNSDR